MIIGIFKFIQIIFTKTQLSTHLRENKLNYKEKTINKYL